MIKNIVKNKFPYWVFEFLRSGRHPSEIKAWIKFLTNKNLSLPSSDRYFLLKKLALIHSKITCAHMQEEMLEIFDAIILLNSAKESGVIVEAGCFKGGSSAKISHLAALLDKEFYMFDSFEGIPDNDENHVENIFGGAAGFTKGDYAGSLAEVKHNITEYGSIEPCVFVKGWFDDTMPSFDKKVSVAYIDVDLVSSTKTCIKYLYPLLVKDGIIFSQDGHLPLIIDLLKDEKFWRDEIGINPPKIEGLGQKKLVKIYKSEAE